MHYSYVIINILLTLNFCLRSIKMAFLSFAIHCVVGLAIRLSLIVYANFHDRTFPVPYTDIDYRVYTDASRFLVNGESPFERHTYRYTPLLALILTPNIILHGDFGKIVFSTIDVIATILIKSILSKGHCSREKAEMCALVWLYNPLTIVISTRGNADSLAVLLVLSTLYFLLKGDLVVSGLLHGLSIHFRLYPIAFSLSMYLSLRGKNYFYPTVGQLKLVTCCIFSLVFFTAISYYFYGYQYLYESLIYHIVRKDAKHNFSVFFYMTYLSTGKEDNIFKRLSIVLPQLVVLLSLSLRYSTKKDLPFAMLTQAIVMVTYNPVMTSQYFFWFLSILPLCLPNIHMSIRKWLMLTAFWILGQSLWLYHAYLLEFKAVNSFYRIWQDGIIFFIVNIIVLWHMIKHYNSAIPIHADKHID